MIEMCPYCGNYNWDKDTDVKNGTVTCPECSKSWNYNALPLFILTGCSGVGKTTTAQRLMRMDSGCVVMDADIFTFMGEDYKERTMRMCQFSADIMQCGKPVLWTMTGCLGMLNEVYHRRFFKDIYLLALVCDSEALEYRMTNGRHITDRHWIDSSVEYNRYFYEHNSIEGLTYGRLDISGMNTEAVAEKVCEWIRLKSNK